MTTWTEVDEPVLRWLFEREGAGEGEWSGRMQLTLRPDPVPTTELGDALSSRQVDDALRRLKDHGLIDGTRIETIGYSSWSQLRLRADGLIVLGEWPDLDTVASFTGLQALLGALADDTDEPDDKAALRRTAGAVGRLGEGIVESTIGAVATDLEKQL